MSEARSRSIGEPILVIDGVNLSFGGVKALQGVSFDVREREIRAIIGPNGAGKSSMLNVINGVYHPQQGSVTYRGNTRHWGHYSIMLFACLWLFTSVEAKRRLSWAFQGLFTFLVGIQVVAGVVSYSIDYQQPF